ncbi:MAG: isoleucine--tRNA ligase, partial [Phototrophicaceae bacterium]
MFKPVDPKVDIQKVEKDQLDFWRAEKIFARTVTEREGRPNFVFYEGPPTANGLPGSHHVLARSFKDLFPRYKTMRGYRVLRKGGWDTHGLPVEMAVQKEIGIEDKRDIVKYGIDKFNQKCRDTVFRNITDWERLTERMAYWVNLDDAYVTFTNDYIESVWWILKQLWSKNLLYRGYKVVPYSPSSGTPLSSHEVALGYKEIVSPSAFVRFPLKDEPSTYLLAWTTTPWTLPSNAALAVGADIDYVRVVGQTEDGTPETLILAEALVKSALEKPERYEIVGRLKGRDLLGWEYHPLYTFFPVEGTKVHYVIEGDFVSTADGTGIVHIAPTYGEDDMRVGTQFNLPAFRAVEEDGRFVEAATPFRGMWFKDADKEIIRDLKRRGLLYRRYDYEHNYPHDWRTGQPLMYFARETWFLRATEYRQRMIDLNQTIKWVPEHVRDGRFGNWLDELKDWALGRERYWGTPLPMWVDDQTGEELCIGSVEELSGYVGRDLSELDLHRPYVDDITFPNPKGTGGTMRRVPEVIDVWFDSGAMPFAQWGYPAKDVNHQFASQYPADYICEAVDQTRGWFYSLHAISVMLNESVAYKNVICLGHILDEKGEKMSKSKGNIVEPWSVLNSSGADALRWYCFTASPPG